MTLHRLCSLPFLFVRSHSMNKQLSNNRRLNRIYNCAAIKLVLLEETSLPLDHDSHAELKISLSKVPFCDWII